MRCAIEKKLDHEIMSLLKEVLQDISFSQKQAGQRAPRTIFDESFYDAVMRTYGDDYVDFQTHSPPSDQRNEKIIPKKITSPEAPIFTESNVEKLLYQLLTKHLV
jgi:hypothetical protein